MAALAGACEVAGVQRRTPQLWFDSPRSGRLLLSPDHKRPAQSRGNCELCAGFFSFTRLRARAQAAAHARTLRPRAHPWARPNGTDPRRAHTPATSPTTRNGLEALVSQAGASLRDARVDKSEHGAKLREGGLTVNPRFVLATQRFVSDSSRLDTPSEPVVPLGGSVQLYGRLRGVPRSIARANDPSQVPRCSSRQRFRSHSLRS